MSVRLDAYGTLRIEGTSKADSITIDYDNAGGCVVDGASLTAKTFPAASVKAIVVNCGDGDDVLFINVAKPSQVMGGGGSDFIKTGGGNDMIYGDESWVGNGSTLGDAFAGTGSWELTTGPAGDDVILSGGGRDHICGNAGGDTVYAGPDDDFIDGGAGFDKLYGDNGDDTFHAADGWYDYINGGGGTDRADFDIAASFAGLRTDVLESIEAVI